MINDLSDDEDENIALQTVPIISDEDIEILNNSIGNVISNKVNFADLYLNWLTPSMRKALYSSKINDKYKVFISGLRYEYGVDDHPIDLSKAYEIYVSNANNNDPLSLLRLYYISKLDSVKFKINRDKDEELFYLLKSYAFSSTNYIFEEYKTHYSSIADINNEISYIFYNEKINMDYLDTLINQRIKEKPNDELDMLYVLQIIKLQYNDKDALNSLQDIANKENLEACHKLGSYYSRKFTSNKLENSKSFKDSTFYLNAVKYYAICEKHNYISSYCDYGSFLYKIGDVKKSEEILLKSMESGYPDGILVYHDLIQSDLKNFESKNLLKIFKLLDYYIVCICSGGNISFIFEYIFLYRLFKNTLLKQVENDKLTEIAKEIKDSLQVRENICYELFQVIHYFTNGKLENSRNLEKDDFHEILMAWGYISYSGFNSLKPLNGNTLENYLISEKYFLKVYSETTNFSTKRFCYSVILKILLKKLRILNKIDKNDKYSLIEETHKRLIDLKIEVFKLYEKSFKMATSNSFRESFYYFFGRIYERGIGTDIDLVKAYAYYSAGANYEYKYLKPGSVISYFRRYKCYLILNVNNELTEKVKYLISEKIEKINIINEKEDEEAKNCVICFSKKREVLFYPCFHLICCSGCSDIILKNNTRFCPFCRALIIYNSIHKLS